MQKLLQIRLSDEMHRAIRIFAFNNGTSASKVASQAIQEFLDRAKSESVPAVESPKPKRRGKGVAA